MRIGEGNPMIGFSLVIDVRHLEMTESRFLFLPSIYEIRVCKISLELYALCLFLLDLSVPKDIYT
jgi:hypothetical protein